MGNCCDKIKQFDPDQSYSKLKKECKKQEKLWEDPKFPASNRLLTGDTRTQFSYMGRSWNSSEIKWLRPHEICQQQGTGLKPEMFVGKVNRFDVNQGEIGDCWFVSPLSLLAENKHFIDKVIPSGQTFHKSYQGIFRFRFYRFGEWVEVVIDDRLPTRNGKLIYLRSKDTNEFWSPLLEKAYAKFYGSYAALEGGVSIDAAVDFTGGIPQVITIQENQSEEESNSLLHTLKLATANEALISTALNLSGRLRRQAESYGLQSSHAYSVTNVVTVDVSKWYQWHKQEVVLLRLRNPQGGDDWKGAWSDESEEWKAIPSGIKKDIGLEISSDGEFFISFEDFIKYFGKIELVNLNPMRMSNNETRMARTFNMISVRGKWVRGVNAGGANTNYANNPQYRMKISNKRDYDDKCFIIVSLTQSMKDRKSAENIGFRIYKVSNKDKKEPIFGPNFINNSANVVDKTQAWIDYREVTLTLTVPPGDYCIVPSTFQSGVEKEFLLRVWVQDRWHCDMKDGDQVKVKDHQCCFVCCHYGGGSCGCCLFMFRRCNACCCKCRGSDCSEQEDDSYQLSSNPKQTTKIPIKRMDI